jgi:hypothetical protein
MSDIYISTYETPEEIDAILHSVDYQNLTEKTTPHADDMLLLQDNQASGAPKKVKVSSLPSGGGSGDMTKAVYDTDDDGSVDKADAIDGVGTAGNSKYYGTNGSGTPGFHDIPSGGGTGDMLKATYDPGNKNADAFSMANMVEGTTNKIFTATERTKLSGIADNANNYSHPSTHSADIITDGSTNKAYTATEKTKLAGIATGAEVNVNADWNASSGDAQILNKPTINTFGGGNATCSTAIGTAAKTVALTGYELIVGGVVGIKLTNGNSAANPTLNINSKGAKPIYANGAAATTIPANYTAYLQYDGTNYNMINPPSLISGIVKGDGAGNQSAAVAGTDYQPGLMPLTTISASTTLALAHLSNTLICTNSSAITITVPPNASVAFAVGSMITIERDGSGSVAIAAGSGVTIHSKESKLSIDGQYAAVTLLKTATDTWKLWGALS